MLEAMAGMHGIGAFSRGGVNWVWISLLIVWMAPNTQQIMERIHPALDYQADKGSRLQWKPDLRWLAAHVLLALFALISISKVSEFIYFQF